MEFHKAKPISLRAHETFNEKWLQKLLTDDPSVLGLGDLVVKDVERRQPRAGRLDLLLSDPETHRRYEVEIQLGATDESHIIRTIEYWDIERSRYPQYDHVAVIVAEDITSRFLNVISLFNRAIPLIAIQLRALDVGNDVLTINATIVLDLVHLGTEEEDEPGQPTDRAYWLTRGSPEIMKVVDQILALINEVTPGTELKYNRYYIGLAHDGVADNFLSFRPRHGHVTVNFRISHSDEMTAIIDESVADSLEYDKRANQYRIRLTGHKDLTTYHDLLLDLIRRASGTPPPVEE